MKTAEVLNLLSIVPARSDEEDVTVLLERPGLRLERIVSFGHSSPPGFWYDQKDGEWVMVVQGQARLQIEGEQEEHLLGPGDSLYLPPHLKHRVNWTAPDTPTVWLALFVADTNADKLGNG